MKVVKACGPNRYWSALRTVDHLTSQVQVPTIDYNFFQDMLSKSAEFEDPDSRDDGEVEASAADAAVDESGDASEDEPIPQLAKKRKPTSRNK